MDHPTAFISWAHGKKDWQKTVLDFATALREFGGVEADLDLWHSHTQWTTFGPEAIEASDFTLIAMDPRYKQRWEGSGPPTEGAGAAREAAALKAMFDRDRSMFLRRVKVVLLPGSTEDDVPADLFGFAERCIVSAFDKDGLKPVLRLLHDSPEFVRPPVGAIPVLPQRFVDDVQRVTADENEPGKQPRAGTEEVIATLQRRIAQLERQIGDLSTGADGDSKTESLRRERDAIQASAEVVTRRQEDGTGRRSPMGKLSDFLQIELDRGVMLRKNLQGPFATAIVAHPATTKPDVEMWVKRVQRVLRDADPGLLSEFNYKPPPSFFNVLGPANAFESQLNKPLDQRIANLRNIIIELRQRGR